ncbi:hypothetical protein [Nitrospirillum iridis]|uniref:Putative membrane protein YeaQ/YmgE (Transglycosylase-associated protein family) n=1 Tax=Nitrospirillum iridis TaxID=765888 RepID=A0A7X0EBT4_9PROT|nr:hypothetical protein [Nitrospirillum iridis]MBB6251022.1 putative membrane protein YeaQ/YmgE (transglycosylase-associated protein family) [Nitrospirillum iridis]
MQLLFCIGLGIVLGMVCGRVVNGRPGFFAVEALLGAIGAVMGVFFFGGLGVPASAPIFLHTVLYATFGIAAAMATLYAVLIAAYWGSSLLRDYEARTLENAPEQPESSTTAAVRPTGPRHLETTIGI